MAGSGRLASLIEALILLSLTLSALNLLPTVWWMQEMHATLAPYYLAAHVVSLFLIAVFRKRFRTSAKLMFACCVGLSANISLDLAPYYLAPPSLVSQDVPSFTIYYANVHLYNQSYDKVREQIAAANPDIVALIETDEKWNSALGLRERYPAVKEIPRDDCFGMSLYSKYPFEGVMVDDFGYEQPPQIVTGIRLPQRLITFALMHTKPPVSQDALSINKVLVRRLSLQLRERDTAVVLAGDLNGSVFAANYARLIHASDLSNAAAGYGFHKTWLAGSPLFHAAIDHIFIRGFDVMSWRIGADIGSDHLPIITKLAADPPAEQLSCIPRF